MAEHDLAKKRVSKRALNRLALSTALGGLAVIGYGRSAYAQCAPLLGTYLCVGTGNTTTESLSDSPLDVIVVPGFGIDTTSSGGNAFTLDGEEGINFFMDGNGSSQVLGYEDGINADNQEGNVVIITTGGYVYGGEDGIRVDNDPKYGILGPEFDLQADTTIRTGDVTGFGDDAIDVNHNGHGKYSSNLTIDTTGGTATAGDNGIQIDHDGVALFGNANLVITTADVDAGGHGIQAYNNAFSALGDATTEIDTTAGTIVSGESGIVVQSRTLAVNGDTNLTVTTADVTAGYGGQTAIDARNYGISGYDFLQINPYAAYGTPGNSNLTINTTAGTVSGYAGDGIFGLNDSFALYGNTNLTITTGDVDTYGVGVTGVNLSTSGSYVLGLPGTGNSNLTIDTTAGSVTTYYSGVYAYNLGTSYGGTSNLTVTTADVSSVIGDGVVARNGYFDGFNTYRPYGYLGSNLTIDTSAGTVTANNGMYGVAGANYGYAVLGDSSVSITTADVSSGYLGVGGRNWGRSSYGSSDLTINTTAGSVYGYDTGIGAENFGYGYGGTSHLTITTAGVTANATDAVYARNFGYGYVGSNLTINTVLGSVVSTNGTGIYARSGAYAYYEDTNLAITTSNVTAGGAGIFAYNSSFARDGNANLDVTTTGATVVAFGGTGIEARNYSFAGNGYTDTTVTTGIVTGSTNGVYVYNRASGYQGASVMVDTRGGAITGQGGFGVGIRNYYASSGAGSVDIDLYTGNVTGSTYGIGVRNGPGNFAYGSSDINVNTTAGTVVGQSARGIQVWNYGYSVGGSSNVEITTGIVTGATGGIFAFNGGVSATGSSLTINSTGGAVTGQGGTGIYAWNDSFGYDSNLTVQTANVTGSYEGIRALNYGYAYGGTSDLVITTTGATVVGQGGAGILAVHDSLADGSALLTINSGIVTGQTNGIVAYNKSYSKYGNTGIDINAVGAVNGLGSYGIYAQNSGVSGNVAAPPINGNSNIEITTGDVTGAGVGISAYNAGDAFGVNSSIIINTTGGTVVGQGGTGILAENRAGTTTGYGYNGNSVVSITTGNVTGAASGIRAYNYALAFGAADLTINTTAGAVVGQAGDGVFAVSNVTGTPTDTDIDIDVADVTASGSGIVAVNFSGPDGTIDINSTAGNVVANGGDGIRARNYSGGAVQIAVADVGGSVNGVNAYLYGGSVSDSLTVTTSDDGGARTFVSGVSGSGITATNRGSGATNIDVESRTTVTGGTQGIYASHSSGSAFTIDVNGYGVVGNRSGYASDLAVNAESTGTGLTLTTGATGTIIGTVDLTDQSDTFNNGGLWDTSGGTNDFGGGTDVLRNTSSNTVVVGNGAPNQMTVFNSLESFENSGRIDFSDGFASDRLTTSGGFAASGASELEMDFFAGGDGAPADLFVINGNVTGTPTTIELFQAGGIGDITGFGQNDGIAVVDVSNTGGTDPADFVLAQTVQVNVYLYDDLVLGSDDIWRVQSQFLPTIPEYEAYPLALLSMSDIGTYRERRGDRSVAMTSATGGSELWLQIGGTRLERGEEGSISETTVDQDFYSVTAGLDMMLQNGLTAGVNLSFSNGTTHVASPHGNGSIDTDGWSLGGTLTYEAQSGLYIDAQGRITWFDSDLMGATGNSGQSFAISVEVGQEIALQDGWSVVPQAQLTYTNVDFDSFVGPFGETVTIEDGDSLIARLGISVDREWSGSNGSQNSVYGLLNLTHEMGDGTRVDVGAQGYDPISFMRTPDETRAEIGLGGSFGLGNGSYIYGDVTASQGLANSNSQEVSGRIGFNFTW
ncbi:autotransporter outer membrane beta-barrel domain-containing protein [Rhodobacterales bacterium HKCCSP123]|nr:autotransporter outer membrane beta-barrel domain-containing protein [Rhodobacterales bacterium HKCCSP123]